MRYLILTVFLNIILPAISQNSVQIQQEAIPVLKNMSKKLNELTTFSYDLKRELNYSSENYRNVSEWSCYFNFDPAISILGFKYQINSASTNDYFNGTEKFELNNTDKTIQINSSPQKKDFNSLSYLYNSMVTLRSILPLLTEDKQSIKTATDTIVNNQHYTLVTINIGKRRIQNLGEGFDLMQTKSNFIYKLIIDKKNNLPIEVLQKNDLNNDFIKTSFNNINVFSKQPVENSWYFTTYLNEYKQTKQKEIPKLISVGSISLDWSLPFYNKNENISLYKLKGKVVLLDFWFKNCSPCIESVPHLNAINKKFKNKNVEVLGINTWDSQKDIAWFYNKHALTYKVLMNGKDLAENYGINAYPTVILIDKEGKIIYAGRFDQLKIEKLIENAL